MIRSSGKRTKPGALLTLKSSQTSHRAKKRRTQGGKEQHTPEMSPTSVLRTIIESTGLVTSSPSQSFEKPSKEVIQAYDLEVVRAIRSGDLSKLKRLHDAGKNLNASNEFGESLLHMACRRGKVDILSFMLREAKVRVDIRDDFGRSPLHDACWTVEPHFEIMDELLAHIDPFMLLSKDVRGSTPFDYVRSHHWGGWVQYLSARKERLTQRILEVHEIEC